MRILDIDLDFFLDRAAYSRPLYSRKRLPSRDHHPWTEAAVRYFIEVQCGISKSIKGRVVKHHDEAFSLWRELISKNRLQPPFEIVHIDSHADIGCFDLTPYYLMGELLHLPPAERIFPKIGRRGMNAGNYLVFAMGCRWVNSLIYVPHDDSNNLRDLLPIYFKDFSVSSGYIELKKCDPNVLNAAGSGKRSLDNTYQSYGMLDRESLLDPEPFISFTVFNRECFKNKEDFDLVILAQSPSFTPVESDELISVICEYIDCI